MSHTIPKIANKSGEKEVANGVVAC